MTGRARPGTARGGLRRAVLGLGAALLAAAGVQAATPQRIVSLLPALTETVCALQACDRLVGTDSFSNWPERVKALPKLGGLDDLQIERVVALQPDLVLVAYNLRAAERLRALGLRVVTLEPKNMADTEQVVHAVAVLLSGDPQTRLGRQLWRDTEARLAEVAAAVPAAWRGRSVYFEIAATPYAASGASFIGELLTRLGLVNVVPAELGPFPQLSPEWVVKRSPQLLMASAAAVREMPRRPGWAAMPALRAQQVCGFEPNHFDALIRPGPRLVEAAQAVLACLQRVQPPPPTTAAP